MKTAPDLLFGTTLSATLTPYECVQLFPNPGTMFPAATAFLADRILFFNCMLNAASRVTGGASRVTRGEDERVLAGGASTLARFASEIDFGFASPLNSALIALKGMSRPE
ncbi:MAG: hypothetical protein V4492_07980 [Chlamydiota bacterium]